MHWWKGLVGGIIGAVGTALVAWLLGAFSYVVEASKIATADDLLRRMEVKTYPGRGNPGHPLNLTADCANAATEILVGGWCQVNNGDANLQNAGIMHDGKTFDCTWRNGSTSVGFSASAYAACLRRKP